jgi:hypothetical protein
MDGGVESGGRIVESSAEFPELTTSSRQLQSKFKHADQFGIDENYSKSSAFKYENALHDFVKDSGTVRIEGTYLNDPAILNYNPSSGLIVVQSNDGSFVRGFKMSDQQAANVILRGSLGGH